MQLLLYGGRKTRPLATESTSVQRNLAKGHISALSLLVVALPMGDLDPNLIHGSL